MKRDQRHQKSQQKGKDQFTAYGKHTDVTRRRFLGTAAAGGAAVLTGGLTSFFQSSASAAKKTARVAAPSFATSASFVEKSIPQLQALLASGQLTSRGLVQDYIQRISALNPVLHAVIELNPQAVAIAAGLDNQRRAGFVRGPLHGIPILVKDNIATNDNMQTTAGSLALVNSKVPADATIIQRLRDAGAIILGKSNLGEWANFRGFISSFLTIGWSARGGATLNAYDLNYTSWGSSSGSAAAAAANMCAAAIGTETDGSITGPSAVENVVGLKPTLGLVSQDGIIPISHQQDTAGPIARTVTDVAILLGVIQSPFGEVVGQSVPADYTQFLQSGALNGARIGRDIRFFDYNYYGSGFPGDEETVTFAQHALDVMESLGATIVDTDTGDVFAYTDDETTALLFEFKAQIQEYLATLTHTDMRTLADLIAFNTAHCPEELVYYGQELFELAESTSGDLTDPVYVAARTHARNTARAGIDNALTAQSLDAIVAPHLTNSTGPAVSGYPNLSMPVGIRSNGRPAGMLIYSTFLHEPQLIGFGYALEQALHPRQEPQLIGPIPTIPPADLCSGLPKKPHVFTGKAHLPHGRIF
ncbi:MAG TPA: amidase family protein [Chthoniobacterales bacterium]